MNHIPNSSRLLLLLCALACTTSVLAQPDLEAIPVESLVKEPRWIPIGIDAARGHKNAGFGIRVKLPDGTMHSLGDPSLGEWAEKMTFRVQVLSAADASQWLGMVRYYRIERAERVLVEVAQEKREIDRWIKESQRPHYFLPLALVATAQSAEVLNQLLMKPLPEMEPGKVNNQYAHDKPYLAAALLRLGDEGAMKLLLSEYRKSLTTRNRYAWQIFPTIIENAYSPQLIKGMMALVAEAPELKFSRHKMKERLNEMKVRGLPLDDLRLLVEGRHPRIKGWRDEAIFIIAEYGSVEDLSRLEKLRGQVKDELARALGQVPPPKSKLPWSDNQRAMEHLDYALILMRCRLWKELKKQP